MTDSLESLRRKIGAAEDLKSVVRTMKTMAAASISEYERAATSLDEYYQAVRTATAACLKKTPPGNHPMQRPATGHKTTCAIVFGSDLGLVGQFNEAIAETAVSFFNGRDESKEVLVVGERAKGLIADKGLPVTATYAIPGSIKAITGLVMDLLLESEKRQLAGSEVYIFHNRLEQGAGFSISQLRFLPLDDSWQQDLRTLNWPSHNIPEVLGQTGDVLASLVHEYLFVSLFRACAQSMASEHAARLAAMQRAEKNIGSMLDDMTFSFNRLRQQAIDEELFDVVSGAEAMRKSAGNTAGGKQT